mmetsp:Transcript_18817/g.62241  ORF Transcript_18817/g.62241 Transcript_18817/m.62241 type:complete len:303 (+) Transcript_18817:27-935(+)
MAPLVGKVVRVIGTQRADLNGQEGRVESFNDATGRYNVILRSGELVALLPARCQPTAGGGGERAGGGRQGFDVRGLARSLPPPHQLAAGLAAVLCLVSGWSMGNAALAALVLFVVMTAVRDPGGPLAAARSAANAAADSMERVTGQRFTPAQVTCLLLSTAAFAYYFWLAPAATSGYGGRGSGYRERGGYDSGGDRRTTYGARRRGSDSGGWSGDGYGGFSSSSWDLGYLLSAGVLGRMVWSLGGGGTAAGWSFGELVRRAQTMDIWQLLMLSNLIQRVLGGGQRRGGFGGYGGYGRRRMYF